MDGVKFDTEKDRWSLMPWEELSDVLHVLMKGSKKYADDNWKKVDDASVRYFNACLRHVLAWEDGEKIDKETGEPHLAHAICCLLFMMWHDDKETEQ